MNRNLQVIIAILLSVALLGVAVFIITYEPKKKQKDVEISTNSEIVTTDPVKTASLYIAANGTMGELSEVNEETLATN
jgi:preprotein translocase subunit YajC